MDHPLQLLANGLVVGAIYSLVAVGLSLVFGVMRVINIAHGDFAMLGAYVAFFAWDWLGLSPLVSLLPAMAILFLFGAGLQRLVIERVVGRPLLASLMLTFGLSLIIWNSSQVAFTTKLRGISYLTEPVTFLGVTMSQSYIVGFVLALILTGALFAFLKFTAPGKAIRATSQNQDVALACGIDVRRARTLAFGIGAALAAAAGTLISMTGFIYPYMGFEYLAKTFTIVVLGGLGSVAGALVAAFAYGLLESFGTAMLSPRIAPALPFVLLIAIMIFRPSGLFGTSVADR
ncbi:amino acid/amide ABC transporter membrane protein 1, HAAT family [Modicisalibacter muralis]|uniref:Amino acid/amide ABC transporter membrane protein 1, HAAT family n=1 Tax=Modicisalibacter muralis TaxID=119000 RepID=A0A1G9FPS8_9GAMM|nr:branched-chain amino acid ABC transporter permease [Halomonas muralis]SDK90390.1 amino acid/amide ABC transporter membrane protein 1, HAAT family [Halomonas muralis]